jgi:hypothetical protein
MTPRTDVLAEAEAIKEMLEELVVVRERLLITKADLTAYREMVKIQSTQLHDALVRVERQTATNIRLRDEIARLRDQSASRQAVNS